MKQSTLSDAVACKGCFSTSLIVRRIGSLLYGMKVVKCCNCHHKGPARDSIHEAVDAWNKGQVK